MNFQVLGAMATLAWPCPAAAVTRSRKREHGARHFSSVGPLAVCLLAALTGCHAMDLYTPTLQAPAGPESPPPRELSMVSLPTYRIEPRDVLQIEVLRLIPRPPYCIDAHDVLHINALGTIPDQPINGYYLVAEDGLVVLGPAYGTVQVAGMTIDEATAAIIRQVEAAIVRHLQVAPQPPPEVSVQLARSAGIQQITGFYAVQPDGMVNLRSYGMMYVAGKTVTEAKLALEERIAMYFDSPQVAVDVVRSYSKSYTVIIAGAEMGEGMRQFPINGNETVLDAISHLQGVPGISSKTIWVSRPAPADTGVEQVLPVDWEAIARGGMTDTNYQILPGDRIYIVDDKLVAMNNFIGQFTDPIGRLLSISSLGASTVRSMQGMGRGYNRWRHGR